MMVCVCLLGGCTHEPSPGVVLCFAAAAALPWRLSPLRAQ
jgi:hypothetical protein